MVRRSVHKMVEEFAMHWKSYILQCLLATATIFVVLALLTMERAVIVASIGATTFVVFATPRSMTAQARNVIGGHVVGFACGALCALLPEFSHPCQLLAYSGAVGLSIFVMVVTDTEHPPAAGTALGVAMEGASLGLVKVGVAVITSALILSLARYALRGRLKDLT
jgi:CBS-domain-containing membrane protein